MTQNSACKAWNYLLFIPCVALWDLTHLIIRLIPAEAVVSSVTWSKQDGDPRQEELACRLEVALSQDCQQSLQDCPAQLQRGTVLLLILDFTTTSYSW